MTDLLSILPSFPTQNYTHLIPSLEKNQLTTVDLLTLDCIEIAKRAKLPLLDVKLLSKAVREALVGELGIDEECQRKAKGRGGDVQKEGKGTLRKSGRDLVGEWNTISTLDEKLDQALGGGIPTGYITEITGESGAGKTQFLLTLLLSTQLPAPHGLSSPPLYISTESSLPTPRLLQLLRTHPYLSTIPSSSRPNLNSIISIMVPDLESQDHILRYQVPVAIRRHGIKLVVLDSVAANYRAEFDRAGGGGGGRKSMAQRSAELVSLGQLLRDLARRENVAVVVANQVGDRFSPFGGGVSTMLDRTRIQNSPISESRHDGDSSTLHDTSTPYQHRTISQTHTFPGLTPDTLSLDHQQRWFTGWGDIPPSHTHLHTQNLKTPSLGLIWTTQIACRIALIKEPVYGHALVGENGDRRGDGEGENELVLKKWRRWMKVVFARHVGPSGWGFGTAGGDGGGGKDEGGRNGAVEFEIRGEGIRAVSMEEGDKDG